ncbi:MAG: acylphosphatase [Desulforhopalus sp.]|nr:acylphosphatase [Desulforhopalus sp.]
MILNSEQKMNTHHSALVQITGIVQGVGFRPFVYRLAKELQISGSVRNDGSGVVVKGCGENLPEFLRRLRSDVPPLARIDSFTLEEQPPLSTENFTILHSNTPENANAEIPADICLCEKCAAEIVDPRNRRFHYPFQLHRLRPTLHHRQRGSLRPSQDLDERLSHVRGLPA